MAVPRQMTAHTLEAPKGWPSPHAVDFSTLLSANVTIDPFFAVRCVHLNAAGQYETGCPVGGLGIGHMAIFTFQNSDDPDVANPGGITGSEADEPGGWMAVSPTGAIMGLVAKGAYEMETTEFLDEANIADGSYDPGDLLQSVQANANAVTGGRLTLGNQYEVPIVGVVSRGQFTNSHRRQALAFWPVWLPEIAAGTTEPAWGGS